MFTENIHNCRALSLNNFTRMSNKFPIFSWQSRSVTSIIISMKKNEVQILPRFSSSRRTLLKALALAPVFPALAFGEDQLMSKIRDLGPLRWIQVDTSPGMPDADSILIQERDLTVIGGEMPFQAMVALRSFGVAAVAESASGVGDVVRNETGTVLKGFTSTITLKDQCKLVLNHNPNHAGKSAVITLHGKKDSCSCTVPVVRTPAYPNPPQVVQWFFLAALGCL